MGIGLVAYSFKIKERRTTESTYENLDDVNGVDILTFISEFLSDSSSNFYIDEESKKTFKVDTINIDENNRRISGFLTYGDGGIPAQIRNINSPNDISYTKVEDDTECIPLYYLFYLPTSSNGILIIEKYRSKSAKSILEKLLKDVFINKFPDKTIFIDLLPQKQLMDMLMRDGIIKQVTLSSYSSPGTHVESIYANSGQNIEELATYEFSIKAKRSKQLNFLKEKINNILCKKANIESISNVVGIRDYKPNNLKVVYDVKGVQKTVKLSGFEDINAVYDITDFLEQKYQHPSYEEINTLANDYLEDLIG